MEILQGEYIAVGGLFALGMFVGQVFAVIIAASIEVVSEMANR